MAFSPFAPPAEFWYDWGHMSYKRFGNEETRTSVLSGVRAGTEEAWGRFFDLYAGYVYGLARRAGLPGPDADEIVQTVFADLSAPNGFEGYERGKGSFRAWLRRRTEWRIADEMRRRASVRQTVSGEAFDFDAVPAPQEGAERDEEWIEAARDEALRRLRETSPEQHFAVFHASLVEGLPTEDVMRLYRVSRDNLYQIRKRMKATFSELLAKAMEDLDSPMPP